MPKTRKQKEESVEDLSTAIKGATGVVFAGFNKLKVADERDLRKQLRAEGVTYLVTKKSLWKRAMEAAGFAGAPDFEGQLALAYGADAIAPAKGVSTFAKKKEGIVTILGGIFEGKLMGAVEMQAIAAIPARETLLAMLANVLNSPIQGLAIALDAVSKQKSVAPVSASA
jgi:large subunit ribosomal protein L10